ncbi:MAG TPA: LysR family transcriptional regulator [Candidatus Limosilactobacillus intestinigallinarum]|jgi:DNA-binding transcriptional LysR family regulator|nr:LysR family transcriptional regulator [Candidatus Limosilactobacillus intestinigallinarum]
MNIKQLQAFLVVVQEHQITAAAKRLYTTQPPLSYQMKQLEKELGVKLFVRNAHGIRLTAAGQTFQRYAQQIVSLDRQAHDELHQEENGETGQVNLGLISSAGDLIPNAAMRALTRNYPRITFSITEGNTFDLVDRLNTGLLDLAVVRTPLNMRGLAKKVLNTDRMVAVGDPTAASLPTPLRLTDLAGVPLILYRRFEAIFNRDFAQAGVTPFYAVRCDDARTAIRWADRGMGVALVPESIARCDAHQVITPVDYPAWNTHVQLVWKKDEPLRPVIRHLIDLLAENYD